MSGYPAEAWLDLHSNGFAVAFDTVNALSGEFTLTDGGLRFPRLGTTLLLQGAATSEQQAVLDAFDALRATAPGASIPVEVVDTCLGLQLPEIRMIFRRAGRMPEPVLPPPASTRLHSDKQVEPIPTPE